MSTALSSLERDALVHDRAEARRVAEDMALEHGADGVSFDDAGRPVATAALPCPDPSPEGDVVRESHEITRRLLEFLIVGAQDERQVGRRVLFLAYRLRLPAAPKTVRALAGFLGVSAAMAHKRLTEFGRQLRDISRVSGFESEQAGHQ